MAALWHRERTGRGQKVTNNLVNTAVLMQWPAIAHYLSEGIEFRKEGRGGVRSRFPYAAYPASDGYVLTIFGQDDTEWPLVCEILEIEHVIDGPSLRHGGEAQRRPPRALPGARRGVLEAHPRGVAGSLPRAPAALRPLPQLRGVHGARAVRRELAGGDGGRPARRRAGEAWRAPCASATSRRRRRRATRRGLGEHTEEVLAALGYDGEEIEIALRGGRGRRAAAGHVHGSAAAGGQGGAPARRLRRSSKLEREQQQGASS